MKIINEKQISIWLSEIGISEAQGKIVCPDFYKTQYHIPIDSGKKTVLSKQVASLFKNDDEILLWINEFGIWPSSEDWNLFEGFRTSLGEGEPLYKKPGHILFKDDIKTFESLLALVFYFIWGAIILSKNNNFLIKISHDEIIEIFFKERENLSYIEEKFNNLNPVKNIPEPEKP